MNKEFVPMATAAVQRTNDILRRYNSSDITATEIKVFLSNATNNELKNSELDSVIRKSALDLIESDYDDISIKKLLLYCYHRVHILPDIFKQHNGEIEGTEKYLYKLATTFIPSNQNISIYAGHISRELNGYEMTIINSRTELYNKPVQGKKLKLESIYNTIIDQLNITDISATIQDEKLIDTMICYVKYNALIMSGTSVNEIIRLNSVSMDTKAIENDGYEKLVQKYKLEVYNIPEVKANLQEDNLYAIASYRIAEQLELLIKNYKENNGSGFVTLAYLTQVKQALNLLFDNISEDKLTILYKTVDGESSLNIRECMDRCNKTLELLAKVFIHENPMQVYNPHVLSFISKDSALRILEKIEHKDEYYFSMYQAGLVSFNEMIEYEKNIKPEYEDAYRVRSVMIKLTNCISVPSSVEVETIVGLPVNDEDKKNEEQVLSSDPISKEDAVDIVYKPENFFRYTLDDNSLYEMMNRQLFQLFAAKSIEHIRQHGKYTSQAKRNLDVMAKRGGLVPEIILSLYIFDDVTLKELENIIGIKKLEELYDANDFIEIYKKCREYDLEKKLSEKEENELEVFKGENRFYTELFARLGYLGNEDREVELLDYLGDLIDDKQVLSDLYQNGLLSVENLHGLNKELVDELYQNNLLRDNDKKYMLFHTDGKVSTGDLIRLSNEGHINIKDVFNLYMQGKYNLDVLKDFSEGLNTDAILNDEDLINKAKRYRSINDKEVIGDFQKYIAAYIQIKGTPSDELKTKLYKAIGGKNSRNDSLIDLYSKGLINIRDIDISKDTLLVDMIKSGDISAEDEEFLFKDTEKDGKKYLRLTKILPYLTSDQKINILASVYGTVDEISTPRIAFLSKYLEEAVEDKKDASDKSKKVKEQKVDNAETETKSSEKTKNLFAFGEKFKAFKDIDANYKHEVASGSYVIYFEKLNTVVLEEIYRTTSNGNDFYNTQHATYIIKGTDEVFNCLGFNKNNNLYDEFTKKLIYPNSKGVNSVDWSKLIQMNRDRINGTSKCLHTTEERWKNTLRKKIGLKSPNMREKIDDCLEKIENTPLNFAGENIEL